MNFHTNQAAASQPVHGLPPSGAQPVAMEAKRQANPVPYGPPTTRSPRGAGGPFNDYDCMIRRAKARGDHEQAAALQLVRAQVHIGWRMLEPVWVPTPGQRAFYGLTANIRSGREGLRTMKAAA